MLYINACSGEWVERQPQGSVMFSEEEMKAVGVGGLHTRGLRARELHLRVPCLLREGARLPHLGCAF